MSVVVVVSKIISDRSWSKIELLKIPPGSLIPEFTRYPFFKKDLVSESRFEVRKVTLRGLIPDGDRFWPIILAFAKTMKNNRIDGFTACLIHYKATKKGTNPRQVSLLFPSNIPLIIHTHPRIPLRFTDFNQINYHCL